MTMLTHLTESPHPPHRVVVMGAGGFVGGAIAGRCRAVGVDVLALTRRDVDLLAAGAGDRLAALLRPDDVFVAASAIAPVKTVAMLADNLTMISAMVDALAKAPVSYLLNVGSDAVFADGPLPLHEGSPRAPDSLHGIMHLAREVSFATLPVRQATLRPTLVYGASDPHNGYGPNRFRRLVAEGKDIVLFGEGEERRDHVLIDDVAELALRMILHRSAGSLNAVTGEVHSFRSLAEAVVALALRPVAVVGSPRVGPMPHGGYRPFDAAAIRAAFPDFVYTPIAQGLRLAQAVL